MNKSKSTSEYYNKKSETANLTLEQINSLPYKKRSQLFSSRNKEIINLYFGDHSVVYTYRDIAKIVGISLNRVSQIVSQESKKALSKYENGKSLVDIASEYNITPRQVVVFLNITDKSESLFETKRGSLDSTN